MSDPADPRRPADEEEPTLSEQIGESIRSEDEPMGDSRPSAPLALVMGTYPIILIVLLLILAAYFFWFRTAPNEAGRGDPAQPGEVTPADPPTAERAGSPEADPSVIPAD